MEARKPYTIVKDASVLGSVFVLLAGIALVGQLTINDDQYILGLFVGGIFAIFTERLARYGTH